MSRRKLRKQLSVVSQCSQLVLFISCFSWQVSPAIPSTPESAGAVSSERGGLLSAADFFRRLDCGLAS